MTRTFDERGLETVGLTSTDTLGVVTLAEKTVNTTDGESKTRLGRTARYTVSMQFELMVK